MNTTMSLHQADTIPSFAFSMGISEDMARTINKGIFDITTTAKQQLPNDVDDANMAKKSVTKKSTTTKHKRRKRAYKPRRVIPTTKTYIEESQPREMDVVSGRGGKSNHHPGNRACWLEMLNRRPAYRAAKTPAEKKEIAQSLIDFVHEKQGGRYVQFDNDTGRWFVLPNAVALEKAKQGLRDKWVPDWVNGSETAANKKNKAVTKKVTKKQSKAPVVTPEPAQPSFLPLAPPSIGMEQQNALSVALSMSLGLSLSDLLPSMSASLATTANTPQEAKPLSVAQNSKNDDDSWGDMFQNALGGTPV